MKASNIIKVGKGHEDATTRAYVFIDRMWRKGDDAGLNAWLTHIGMESGNV